MWIETTTPSRSCLSTRSLPTWECGLKHERNQILNEVVWSLPTWECGLKPSHSSIVKAEDGVTPHVGVWIETAVRFPKALPYSVTPHVGVWIETIARLPLPTLLVVTPHVGVWIETYVPHIWLISIKSLPTWECGLKPRHTDRYGERRCHSPRGSVD